MNLREDMARVEELQRRIIDLSNSDIMDTKFNIQYFYQPQNGTAGGDFFLYGPGKNDEEMWFAFGDVAGKGYKSAMLMMMVHNLIKFSMSNDLDIESAITEVNDFLCSNTLTREFVTCFMGYITPNDHGDDRYEWNLYYVNCGHETPIAEDIEMKADLPPLGLVKYPEVLSNLISFETGDSITLYSDGISDSIDSANLGERIEEILEDDCIDAPICDDSTILRITFPERL